MAYAINYPRFSFISDTETRPTLAMRKAMANAEVGDEQRGQDPTVNRLQERVAALVGKEAALWLPGGTVCNLIAVKVHTRPGDVMITEQMAHILRAESAGFAVFSGVIVEPIATERGIFTSADLDVAMARIRASSAPYGPSPRLVCIEQTHNFGGGSIWSIDELEAVSLCAREYGLAIHMDGARLLNACVATGIAATQFCAHVDTVWIDFAKGLGAPMGAVLAGSVEFIAEARRYKHLLGAATRQAGIVAAACLHALDHNVERLAEDHENARLLARRLGEIQGISVRTPIPESNIVFFHARDLGLDNSEFLARLFEYGISMGESCGEIRAVLHPDLPREGVEAAVAATREIAAGIRRSSIC